jgi:hypothetical protein
MGTGETKMANFAIYMIGVILFIGALAFGAQRIGVAEPWIWIGIVALIGIGIMAAVVNTKRRTP